MCIRPPLDLESQPSRHNSYRPDRSTDFHQSLPSLYYLRFPRRVDPHAALRDQITPFFVASAEPKRSFTAVRPQAVSYADRPTFSFVPIDDAEFTRKLFTPLTLDGVLYLAAGRADPPR
jgi:hypothetical protein